MSPSQRRRQPRLPVEVRKEQVLDAALRLITDQGYAAASMEAVAREADLAKPRVYQLFPGRGPLLQALLEREERRAIATLTEAMPPVVEEADLDTTLVSAAEDLLRSVSEHPVSWRLLLLPAEDTPPEVRDHVAAGREQALRKLRVLLSGSRTKRPALKTVDLELMARALLTLGEDAVRMVLTDPAEYPPQRYSDFARALVSRF